jgi:hypothetical protein
MLHSAKEEKTGEIFSGHPRRHAFGKRYIQLLLCHATIASVIARLSQRNPLDFGGAFIQYRS